MVFSYSETGNFDGFRFVKAVVVGAKGLFLLLRTVHAVAGGMCGNILHRLQHQGYLLCPLRGYLVSGCFVYLK